MHLAHNPLDTLREEEDFQQGGQYSSGAIHALEMLNQVGFKSSWDIFEQIFDDLMFRAVVVMRVSSPSWTIPRRKKAPAGAAQVQAVQR